MLKLFIVTGGFVAALVLIHNYVTGDFANIYHKRVSVSFGDQKGIGSDLQAFFLLFPISVGISLILEQKKRIGQILLFLVTFTIIMGVVTTGTRGALVAIFVFFIVYLFFMKNKITPGIVILVIIAVALALTPEHFISHVRSATDDGGSGRLVIWMVGLKSLQNYWLTGAGFNNFPVAYNDYVDSVPYFRGISRAPHNIFLGTFVELGIVGFVLLIVGLMKHYQAISFKFIRENADEIMLKATFWGILAQSFFLDTIWIKSFWLLWMMILMYRNVMNEKYHQNDIL